MSDHQSDFLARLAQRVADSDAQVDADLADIKAGRPFKRREAPPKAKAARKPAAKDPAAPKKPRAKRKPKKTEADE